VTHIFPDLAAILLALAATIALLTVLWARRSAPLDEEAEEEEPSRPAPFDLCPPRRRYEMSASIEVLFPERGGPSAENEMLAPKDGDSGRPALESVTGRSERRIGELR
jgi:hypothetical protein